VTLRKAVGMRDFSLGMLKELLAAFKDTGYTVVPFERYWAERESIDAKENVVLLRHDVDRLPATALATARAENETGIRGTYFFRVKPWTFKREIIEAIAGLGHEIGYHYETLADARGDFARAKTLFEECLGRLREIYPVVSASMHSRPLSKWDNRSFWDRYPLSGFGLLGESYRSIDHHRYLYVADSGRNWNADRNVVWDSVEGGALPRIDNGTRGLIREIRTGSSIRRTQLLIHPNRWPATMAGEITQYAADRFINAAKIGVRTYRRVLARR
jgi:hypothetical protein